jgi:type I restriction enzyme M protein
MPETYRWRNWAADPEGITGEELMSFVDNELFPALQTLQEHSATPVAFVMRSVFEDAYNYMKSGQLLRQVLNKIQAASTSTRRRSGTQFGDMYEQLLRDLQNAGNAGEFYTPRAGHASSWCGWSTRSWATRCMDPACGTGGFLTCTIEHLRQQVKKRRGRGATAGQPSSAWRRSSCPTCCA